MKHKMKWIMMTVMLFCMTDLLAQDWPQYLGPHRNSTSEQKGILGSWPEEGPEILWTVGVGIGYGGPVARDGKAYLLDRDDEVGDMLRCFDLDTGEELWRFEYEAPGSVSFPGSRSVPAIDGSYIYTCGPYGDLYCTDINTQKPVWHNNVWSDFGGEEIPRWAITQCPLVYGDMLILASQAPEAGVVAYDKRTGDLEWQTPPLGKVGYVSPAVAKIGGEDHIIMATASEGGRREEPHGGRVVGIEPETGAILWEYTNWHCRIPAPSAFDAGGGRVLIIGGYRAGAAMFRVSGNASGGYDVNELFKTEEFGSHTKPPLMVDGYFYAQYGTNDRRDGLVCMDTEGEIMWKTGTEPEFNKGSMIVAEGLILATDGAEKLYLIEPDPAGFKPLASAALLAGMETGDPRAARSGTQNWAPIALAEGKLLIRDQNNLVCVRVAE